MYTDISRDVKRVLFLYAILTCIALSSRADHITGGAISYELKSVSGNQYTYTVTVKMYMVCHSYREFYNPTYVSFFDKKSNARVKDMLVPLTSIQNIELTSNDECITNPPDVCHRIGFYIFDVTLPASVNGYILTSEVFFRVNNMSNLATGYENLGATYTAEIPGTFILPTGPKNNSAKFVGNDLVIICAGNPFNYSFAAEDKDGDELFYSLCSAYRSDNFMFGIDLIPPAPPPYNSVPYGSGFSSGKPFGDGVSINEKTGMISGIAPKPGTYVITVCVEEHRDGKFIATQRKDLQINVASCSFTSALLPEAYLLCGNSKTVSMENLSTSPLIESYKWRVSNSKGADIYTTDSPTANYTFTDTGLYNVRLDVNQGRKCADSAFSQVRVYPGFKPDFKYSGVCMDKRTQFTDATSSLYGTINSWLWNFTGDGSPESSSVQQNPEYTYASLGVRNVTLKVTDTKGCMDSVIKAIEIFDKPPVELAFRDTLICKPDSLQLNALGVGIYKWTPLTNILNPESAQPTVSPLTTTTYYVDLTADGCNNRDSVIVRVVDHVTLQIMNDTTICNGDAALLRVESDGLKYNWSPASQMNDATLQQPTAYTTANTIYHVTANIGHCIAEANVNVKTVPYPTAIANADTTICFGATAFLNGITNGSSYQWYPPTGVSDARALHTLVSPDATTTYTLITYDTRGCPKPGLDSVTIFVQPEIHANAGNDTSIVVNQPLQLHGSGGNYYQWSPATFLSAYNTPDPVANFIEASQNNRYKLVVTDQTGCSDSAFINIKVYKTIPSVFVPTGFTPNGDGRNDILRPIIAGIQRIDAFNIYTRWGQVVYSTQTPGAGWDGRFNGVLQASQTYVWIIKAVDYNGLPYFNKGTVTLIR